MASVEINEPTNACDFRTGTRTDGSRYTYKASDCGQATCKYSTNYVPPQRNSRMGKYSDLPQRKALIIAIRFIPNYSQTWVAKYGGRRHEVGHSEEVQSTKLVQLFYQIA